MPIRKRRITKRGKKSSGHPFMVLLFFICLIMGSAYMTDRMTNAPDADMAENVTAIRHIFNDKEMQGLVPKDDPGTPESVKEKVKAALNKAVTVEVIQKLLCPLLTRKFLREMEKKKIKKTHLTLA